MPKQKEDKTYVKQSLIPNVGFGLFAKRKIKRGERIAQFQGKLCRPGAPLPSERSNIRFYDGYTLSCYDNDMASFANDCIDFPKNRRQFMKTLKSNDPFYKMHKGARLNSSIELGDSGFNHNAYLVASQDIEVDEEIFVHYGFIHWFYQEAGKGFSQEAEIEKNGIPDKFYEYPGFQAYVKEYYPETTGYRIETDKNEPDKVFYVIELPNTTHVTLPLPDCKKFFVRFDPNNGEMKKFI
jgi:hypothetical protein